MAPPPAFWADDGPDFGERPGERRLPVTPAAPIVPLGWHPTPCDHYNRELVLRCDRHCGHTGPHAFNDCFVWQQA